MSANFQPLEFDFSDLEGQYDLPKGLLNSVMKAESNGKIKTVSPKGAQGPFQFMPKTAKQYGVDVTDLRSSAEGAAKYFRNLLDMHDNDLPKAVASYNWGEGNVKKYGLNKAPPETQNYLNKVLTGMPAGKEFIPVEVVKDTKKDFIPVETVADYSEPLTGGSAAALDIGASLGLPAAAFAVGGPPAAIAAGIAGNLGPAVGGIAGLGSGAAALFQGKTADEALDEAVKSVHKYTEMLRPSNILRTIAPEEKIHGPSYEKTQEAVMYPITEAGQLAGRATEALGGGPLAQTAADVAAQGLVTGLIGKGVKSGTEATIKPDVEALRTERGYEPTPKKRDGFTFNVELPEEIARNRTKLKEEQGIIWDYFKEDPEGAWKDWDRPESLGNIESTPEIPPRILESAFPEIRPDMITKDLPKDPEVVNVTHRVNYIAKLIEEDATIGRVQFEIRQLQKALERRNRRNESKRLDPRVRGTDYVEQKLLEAKRWGTLSQEGVSLARWMLSKNPNLGADLAISIVSKMKEEGSSGRYTPLARLMKLKEGSDNPLTIAHEILHHTERMLPPKIQDAIRGEWLKRLIALENHARKTNDRLAKAAIADVFRASAGDEQAARRVREAIIIGDIDKDFYQYTSPSEFWAENGSRILRDKAHASKSWVREVKQWLKEFIERLKSYAGIDSDHAVIQALNEVLNPKKITGEFKSKEMLSESKREVSSAPRDTAQSKARNQERIIQLLRSEQTFGRFLRKARTLDLDVSDARWKEIFDNRDRYLATAEGQPSTFSKRSGAEKILGTDTRDWKQFSEEVLAKAKLVKNIDDIKDFGTYLLAPRNLQFLKNRLVDGPIGAKVMSWAIDKNYSITRMWDRIASEVIHGPSREGFGITTMREFKKGREGVLKPMTDLKRKDQADVLRAWLDMEKDNSELVAKKLQWADDAMLRNKYHLTEPQIKAYKSMTKLMDTLMDITNESLVKQGREPIQKIPGFFPRYLKGRYRIHLHIKPSDVMKAAGVKGGLVDILQFKSRAAADAWLKDNFGKDPRMPDRNGFFIGRGKDGDFVQGNSLDVDIANFASDMSIAAQVMMSKGKLNPILRRRLNNLVSRASSAELRQTHERSGALTTYRGSEGIRDTLYGELADTTEILNVFNQYTQSVFKYAKNVDLHTEVLLPIREAIGGKLPNTLRYVDEMIGNAMDNNVNIFEKSVDKFLDNMQGKWVEPGTIQKAVPWINKALIAKALAGSGSFLVVQTLQPYVAATMFLPMFHAEMVRFGNKVPIGASTRAMTRAFKELYIGLSPEGREAMAYAVKNHITDTAIWETLQKDLKLKGLIGDSLDKAFHRLQIRPILENIESASRGHTFMQGYFYARNAGFTKDASLGFADKYTSVMMGDYSKVFRPLMMENLGVVGHLQTPFATLMNTYIGNMAQGTSNLAKSLATMPGVNKLPYMPVVKKLPGIRDIDLTEPNRPQFKQAAIAAAAFTGAVWAWSGFQGMPGVQEWQAAADKWNEHFPENPMVGPQEMMFEHDVSDFNKYGLASTLVGANIGQSMNAPSLAGRMGVPSAPLISDLGEIIWSIFRTIFSEGKTEGEMFRLAGRIAPPPLRAEVERRYTTETGMVPVPGTSLQGFRERTTGDKVARYLGTRSIEEANELARFWITAARDSRENKAKAMLARQVMSAWMTNAPQEKIEAILDQAESVGADPADVIDNATDLYLGRYIGWKERKQLKAGEGISGAHKLQNLENLYRE